MTTPCMAGDPRVRVGHVIERPAGAAPAGRDSPARRAAHQLPQRGHRHPHQIAGPFDGLDVNPGQAEHHIAPRKRVRNVNSGGCVNAPRSVRHVEVLASDQHARPLPIIGDLDPYTQSIRPSASRPTGSAKCR